MSKEKTTTITLSTADAEFWADDSRDQLGSEYTSRLITACKEAVLPVIPDAQYCRVLLDDNFYLAAKFIEYVREHGWKVA